MKKVKKCVVCSNIQRKIFSYQGFGYFKCKNCGLVSTCPYPSKAEIKGHYKDKFKSGNYRNLLENRQDYKPVYLNFAERLEKYIKEHNVKLKDKSLLDVGCFTGDFLSVMKSRGYDVYGVELQQEAVNIANKNLDGRVDCIDILDAKLERKFDIVSLAGLIEHLINPYEVLKKSKELLYPNGIVFIQTPDSSSFFAQILGRYWPPYSPVEHIHLFSKKSIRKTLRRLNFKDIIVQKHIKKLPVSYVYQNMKYFGPEFYKMFKPFSKLLFKTRISLPFYIGEMIVMARRGS